MLRTAGVGFTCKAAALQVRLTLGEGGNVLLAKTHKLMMHGRVI